MNACLLTYFILYISKIPAPWFNKTLNANAYLYTVC